MQQVRTLFALGVLVVGCAAGLVSAQDANGNSQEKPASVDKSAAPSQGRMSIQPYRLDFSFNEVQDGKKINTRHYSLDLTAGIANQLKIGTRVPIATGPSDSNFQYMDVGTRIWANISVEGGGDLRLMVTSEVSNLDVADHNPATRPIVRQIEIEGSTLLVTGKPILVGSMDDPNYNRQFQLEVTATKLR